MVFVTVASVASVASHVTGFDAECWIIIGLNVGLSVRKHDVVRRNRNHAIFASAVTNFAGESGGKVYAETSPAVTESIVAIVSVVAFVSVT